MQGYSATTVLVQKKTAEIDPLYSNNIPFDDLEKIL